MAIDDELAGFVRESLNRGLPRADIEAALRAAGWHEGQARAALAAYADTAFPVPVPRPRVSLSPRDAFLYLVLFSTLYLSAVNFGSLVFDLINRACPDPALDPAYGYRAAGDTMRWSIATLIVAFPVFRYVSRAAGRDVARDPRKRQSPVRRWLTYLTLFLGACVLIGDLIMLVFNALGGDLTTRFVLKVATVGLIAGVVFGTYLRDLRREEEDAS